MVEHIFLRTSDVQDILLALPDDGGIGWSSGMTIVEDDGDIVLSGADAWNFNDPVVITHTADTPLRVINTAGGASVQGLAIEGQSGSPANLDIIYGSFYLNNLSGNRTEVGRLSARATVLTDGAETSQLFWATRSSGTLADRIFLQASTLAPVNDNTVALGAAGFSYADLFLGSGGVLNFANGTYTVTQAGSTLNFSGGITLGSPLPIEDLPLGTAGYLLMGNGASAPSYEGFLQAGTGAVEQAWLGKVQQIVSVKDFGAVGDGVADDTAAIQLTIDYVRSLTNGGTVYFPFGQYRITSTLDCFPDGDLIFRGDGYGSQIVVDFEGPDTIGLKGTHPSVPSTRGSSLVLVDLLILPHDDVTIAPVLFEKRYASGVGFRNVQFFGYKNNTLVSMSGMFNCNFGPTSLWGGGYNVLWKDTTGVTFSISSAGTTLTSSVNHFGASDVGKSILVNCSRPQVFTISGFTDPQTVTVSEAAASAGSAVSAVWEPIRGDISTGTDDLVINRAGLTADDIGRVVYILGAVSNPGSVTEPLRAIITNVSGTAITLDRNASATVAGAYVLLSPCIELYNEDNSTNITNDAVFYDLHLEQFRGVGLAAAGINVMFQNLKLHAQNSVFTANSSSFRALFYRFHGYASGEFEGQAVNSLGSVHVSGQLTGMSFPEIYGAQTEGTTGVYFESGSSSSMVTIGDVWQTNQVSNTTVAKYAQNASSGVLRGPTNMRWLLNASENYRLLNDKVVFGNAVPSQTFTSGRIVAAQASGNTLIETVSIGSPQFMGTAYGTSLSSPTAVGDFGSLALFGGRGYVANGTMFEAARITMRGRNPTGTTLDGELLFLTATSGSLTARWNMQPAGHLIPSADNAYTLGASGAGVADLFLGSGAVINFAAGDVTETHATNTLTWAGATSGYQFQDGPIRPVANDGISLGVAGGAFSDLFLAEGGVINWDSSDVTLTQTGNDLTWAGITTMQFDMGGTAIAKFGVTANYNVYSLNNSVALNGSLGMFGGASGDANFLYLSAPSRVVAYLGGTERHRFTTTLLNILPVTATPAGGTAGSGIQFGSTTNFGIFFGSGAPTLSAAQGSLYIRSDGSATNNRAYINTDGGTTWTALTTVA